jgi:hypothetical protein
MNALPINKIFLAGFAFALTHWKKIIEISVVPVLLSMPLFFIIIDPNFLEILSKIVEFVQKQPPSMLLNNIEFIQLAKKRVMGIVSRGGSILAEWMSIHKQQNPLYENCNCKTLGPWRYYPCHGCVAIY